jgi:thiosulfate reductase cytochrome b subunit
MSRILVYKRFERFWHWAQAGLIIFLAVTGFEIHGSIAFFGFDQAVTYHNAAAITFLLLILFASFWHLTTGEWKHYVPTRMHLGAHVSYYLTGIFREAPHPTKENVLSKLNPLQKLVYAGLKLVVIPVMATSGLLYMFARYPMKYGEAGTGIQDLWAIALLHTAGAYVLVAFLVSHLYLMTTGRTVTSNLRAMVTGYEERRDGEAGSPVAEAHPESIEGAHAR